MKELHSKEQGRRGVRAPLLSGGKPAELAAHYEENWTLWSKQAGHAACGDAVGDGRYATPQVTGPAPTVRSGPRT